jgi:hypothetical protein
MKLNKKLKERIDNYFDNISAEELFGIAVTKYKFTEVNIDIVEMPFEVSEISKYYSGNSGYDVKSSESQTNYAMAA